MPRHSLSKRSVTSRALRATKRDKQEARLQQAAAEVGNGTHNSIRKAAAANNVPEATLRHRLEGRPPKKGAQEALQKLTPAAECALVQHIERCALSGYPLTPALLCEYANTVTHVSPGSSTLPTVSHAWLQSFLLQHDSIRSHWSRCLDNSRITGATKDNIIQWFIQLANILREYSVASTNIFNMDETGFMFGQSASERVVVPSGDPASRFKAQPGSRESATVIECIGSGGQVLPPLIITKGRVHTVGEQRRMDGVPLSWHFSKTVNGWTNNELAIEWFTRVFDPSTKPPSPSDWQLLILDGHASHTSAEFCNALWSHRVIPFLLPAHATHVMQPLDVSIFGPLTGMFKRLISSAAEHVDGIDKAQFGTLYAQARERVLTQPAARKAFADCGITLTPSPDKVLARLAGGSGAAQQQTPIVLQEPAIPRSDAALDATIDAHRQESDPREAQKLKRAILQAHEEAQASIAVLEAKNKLLRHAQERSSKTARKVGKKVARGDQRVLSKDVMITREHAEKELAAKGPPKASGRRAPVQEEEEEDQPPALVAVPDHDEASDGGDKALLALFTPSPPPSMQQLLDDITNNMPPNAIADDDEDPFGFFKTLPVAGPSRSKH